MFHEVMGWPGPQTNRQYRAWHTWWEHYSTVPSRADNYAMQIAYEVASIPHRLLGEGDNPLRIGHFKLVFEEATATRRMTPEQEQEIMRKFKEQRMSRFGVVQGWHDVPPDQRK